MAGFIANEILNEIKDRGDIVDIIGRYVNLKRTGSNYKGLCPFHNEKTPSFVVSAEKQIFTCFGCGKSGDAITFLQEYNNIDFVDAVEMLANEVGVEIPKNGTANTEISETLFKLNREAGVFFFKNMRSRKNQGFEYMKERGLTEDTLKNFGIGWADKHGGSLYNYLAERGYSSKSMLEAGLITSSDGKFYDKFRERVIFPIQNRRGKIIGFGGRAMGDNIPKYLNSPETVVFKKKDNLYGLNITAKEIRQKNQVILVEGYMDVISLYQGGIRNVTASLGTSLTESQAQVIRKMTKNVVISYDSDNAGINATLRAMDILRDASCHVSIAHVTGAKDPDEYIKKFGKQEFLKLISAAKSYGEYKIDLAASKYDLDDMDERIRFMEDVIEILNGVSKIEREIYAKYITKRFGISEEAILSGVDARNRKRKKVRLKSEDAKNDISSFEKTLIKICLTDSTYLAYINDYKDMFETTVGRGILENIFKKYEAGKELNVEELCIDMDPVLQKALVDIDVNVPLSDNTDEVYRECLHSGKKLLLKRERENILAKLSLGQGNEDTASYKEMTNRLSEILQLLKHC